MDGAHSQRGDQLGEELRLYGIPQASACIHFDGIVYDGHTLRIRRPKDYAAAAAAMGLAPAPGVAPRRRPASPPASPPGAGGPQTQVPDTPNTVFVGGIPSYFNEEQVQELLITVGPLKHFNLIGDQVNGLSKGYAFCERIDNETTDKACAALNGIQLGEKTLVVQRSNSAMRAAAQESMGPGSAPMAPQMPGMSMGSIARHPLNINEPAPELAAGRAHPRRTCRPARARHVASADDSAAAAKHGDRGGAGRRGVRGHPRRHQWGSRNE